MRIAASKSQPQLSSTFWQKATQARSSHGLTDQKIKAIQQKQFTTIEELEISSRKWTNKSDFFKQVKKHGKTTLSQTIKTCEKIWKLKTELKLTTHQLFNIALFIETKFKREIKKGHFYIGRGSHGLDRSIEYDPKTKRTFIHLANSLGSGTHKVVTKSLMYNHYDPRIVANASTSENINNEVKAHKKFRHMQGLAHTYAITQHVNKKIKKKMTSIILKHYNAHSVHHYQANRGELTKKEELTIARDLLYGLENMHKQGLVHRDMHPYNFLVNREVDSKTRKETISAVLIDFGRTIKKEQAGIKSPWMPTKQINAPETFSNHPKKINYKATDVYALGYQLYHLHYGQPPEVPTRDEFAHAMRGINTTRYNFRKILSGKLEKFRKAIKKEVSKKEAHHRATPYDLYKKVIAQMCNPNPKARSTAHELRKKVDRLLEKM